MKTRYLLIAVLLVLSVGCQMPTPGSVDVGAERTAILAADKAWSESVSDLDTFVSFFAEDARFLVPDGPQANGHDEIRQSFSALAALPGFSLTWSANYSDVSSGGDLGYSVGTFEMTVDGPDGAPAPRTGKYTTVWKKQNDGQWKVVSDIPNFDSPAGSPASGPGDGQSLYQRLGGYDALVAMVGSVGAGVGGDPAFGRFFDGMNPESGKRVEQLAVLHLCEAAGGSCSYVGRDLKTVHGGLGITDEQWQLFMGYLGDALSARNVGDAERAEVNSIFSGLKDEIVSGAQ